MGRWRLLGGAITGGTISNTTVLSGGTLLLFNGAKVSGTTTTSSGSIEIAGISGTTQSVSTPTTTGYLVESGGLLDVVSGGVVSGLITINDSTASVTVVSGGQVLDTNIKGGEEYVSAGGIAASTAVRIFPSTGSCAQHRQKMNRVRRPHATSSRRPRRP